jgi:hypothetical protein
VGGSFGFQRTFAPEFSGGTMRSLARLLGSAAFGALLVGVPLLAQGIKIDYNPSVNFKLLKSYSWQKIHATDPQVEQRISAAVDRDLANLALHEVDKNADVVITVVEVAKDPQEYTTFYNSLSGFTWRRGWGTGGFADSIRSVRRIPLGTLVFDMYDGKTHKLLWRATVDEFVSKSTDKNDQTMDKAINGMLDKFPPKKEK